MPARKRIGCHCRPGLPNWDVTGWTYRRSMQQLFDLAFAQLDRAENRRVEFENFVERHPWNIDLTQISTTGFECFAVQREPTPVVLSMIFSEWLATI